MLIAAEHGRLDAKAAEVLNAPLSSELLYGCHRAATPQQERARRAFVDAVLDRLTVVPFDRDIAEVHARLSATLDRGLADRNERHHHRGDGAPPRRTST